MAEEKIAPVINGTPVPRETIVILRQDIESVANKLRAHIQSRGSDAHIDGDTTYPGFMSPELYRKLISYQAKIDILKNEVEKSKLPQSSIIYWGKSEDLIPDDYTLCDGSNSSDDFRSKYVMGASNDAECGTVAGKESVNIGNLPVPRHTHSFKNYYWAETESEIKGPVNSTSNAGYDSKWTLGSENDGNYWDKGYPLCYPETTSSTSGSSTNVTIQPPYRVLKTILRKKGIVQYAADGIGTLHLLLGTNVPAGLLELNGALVSRTLYKELYKWAQSNALLTSEGNYTSILNTYGSCAIFSEGDDSTTFRLPKLRAILAGNELSGTSLSEEKISESHFHGLGRMQNNNGNWGRYSYSGAKYPSGTTGWFWNGKGGHSTVANPDTNGDIIISYNINVGTTGNGELTDSTNVGIAIRAYHPEAIATIARTTELNEAISVANITTENLNDDGMAVADAKSNPDNLGWYYENDGTLETWGTYEASVENMPTIIYTQSMNNNPVHISLRNQNPESSDPVLINFDATKMVINLGTYTPGDIIEYVVHGY